MHASNSITKFADDTTVVGLITNNYETAYREESAGSVLPGKYPLTQCRQNKGADRGFQETTEGAHLYPHRWERSGAGGKLQVPWYTHH